MANTYPAGSLVRVTTAFTVSGVATDPSAITLQLKTPGSGVVSLVYGSSLIVRDGVGQYHYDWQTTLSGLYPYRWIGTGVVVAANENEFLAGPSQFV